MDKNILMDHRDDIVILTINRPKELNALNQATMQELADAISLLAEDQKVRALIITGGGEKAFVAGADIREMADMDALEARRWSRFGQQVFSRIEGLPYPVIAAINGFALGGGCELALSCDIRIASSQARFGQPEINLGIIPGFAGTQRLTRLVGKGRAKMLIYGGDMINADEAMAIGLVDVVVAAESLLDSAYALAKKYAEKAPLALAQAKSAIDNGADMEAEKSYKFEAEAFGLCFATGDQKEGMKAFLEKRKPAFRGK